MVKACHQAVAIRFFELCTLSLYFGVELMGHAKNKDQKYKALLSFPVILSRGSHPFPSRTRKLSLSEPMVLRGKLRGRVGRRRINFKTKPARSRRDLERAFVFSAQETVPRRILLTPLRRAHNLRGPRDFPWHTPGPLSSIPGRRCRHLPCGRRS